jgi:hypothetical protein
MIKNKLYVSLIAVFVLVSAKVMALEHVFDVPPTFTNKPFVNPAKYLETYEGHGDTPLSCKEFLELKNLLIAAAYYAKVNYGQDYSISTASPIFILLKKELPKHMSVKERESGNLVMLSDIADLLMVNSRALFSLKCSVPK